MVAKWEAACVLAEIESALLELAADDLQRVEEILQQLRRQGSGGTEMAQLEKQNGFEAFPKRTGGVVTVEAVRQLCAEEGV